MLVAALRQRILDLAIRGKLVPQRPEDGTAEELYQQIQQEKKKLIAAGKLKKEKPLPPISEDEIPFDIPESWKWVRLQSICSRFSTGPFGTMLHKCDYSVRGIPVVNPTNIIDGSIVTKKVERISEETRDRLAAYKLNVGDIVLARRGNLAKSAAVGKNENGWLCGTGSFMIHPIYVSTQWFCHLYVSQYVQSYLLADSVGTTMNNLNQGLLGKLPIPLPPLAEQQRIVEKVGALFAELESIERSQEKVAAIQGELNKRILERAIQGKLVPQRPEDGTAEELYQQIQKEKKKLIAAGKLKKEKPLPSITEDEVPFDIPDFWKWVRMGDIFMHNTGKAQNSTAETRNGITRKFITTSNVYWNRFDFTKVKEMLFTEKEIEKCSVQKGDLLVCEGGDCGRAAIWQDGESMCIQNHIHRLRPYVGVEIMFFYYVFWLLKQMGYINGKGVGIKGLSSNTLHKLPCPLPPLAEQERIVKKLELMLPQIGQTTAPTNA